MHSQESTQAVIFLFQLLVMIIMAVLIYIVVVGPSSPLALPAPHDVENPPVKDAEDVWVSNSRPLNLPRGLEVIWPIISVTWFCFDISLLVQRAIREMRDVYTLQSMRINHCPFDSWSFLSLFSLHHSWFCTELPVWFIGSVCFYPVFAMCGLRVVEVLEYIPPPFFFPYKLNRSRVFFTLFWHVGRQSWYDGSGSVICDIVWWWTCCILYIYWFLPLLD